MAKMVLPYTKWDFVSAVRADPMVGLGSCSVIDECFDDEQLFDLLWGLGARSPGGAVRKARAYHREDVAAYNEMRSLW